MSAKHEHSSASPENSATDPEPLYSSSAPEESGGDRIAALQAAAEEAKDQMMRALAEADNARKRAVRDREEASKYAISTFARDLLEVADNLRRALEAIPAELLSADPRVKSLMEGIDATERNLLKTFEKNGIRRMDPLNAPFNPNFHEVLFETPGTGKPAGIVVHVMETGYTLNDRLLRPAKVGVAKDDGNGNTPPHPGGRVDTAA